MPKKSSPSTEEAQAIALKILGFIAKDDDRYETFLRLTGCAPAEIAAVAGEPHFLAGVCDYLLDNQPLLLVFAEMEEVSPEAVVHARGLLPGSTHDV